MPNYAFAQQFAKDDSRLNAEHVTFPSTQGTGETARAPGITRYWNESWYPVRNEGGEIIGSSAVAVDITERKHAEAALRHTNECFELAVKASKVVLFQQDLELRYRWMRNPVPGFG